MSNKVVIFDVDFDSCTLKAAFVELREFGPPVGRGIPAPVPSGPVVLGGSGLPSNAALINCCESLWNVVPGLLYEMCASKDAPVELFEHTCSPWSAQSSPRSQILYTTDIPDHHAHSFQTLSHSNPAGTTPTHSSPRHAAQDPRT